FLTRRTSEAATSVVPSRRRVSLVGLCSIRCRRPTRWRRSLPLPVTRTRLAVPLCVLFFGILPSFERQHTDSRCAAHVATLRCPGAPERRAMIRAGSGLGALGFLRRLRLRLGVLVRRQHHDHVAAVLLRLRLD